jgi:hypothetical protein
MTGFDDWIWIQWPDPDSATRSGLSNQIQIQQPDPDLATRFNIQILSNTNMNITFENQINLIG